MEIKSTTEYSVVFLGKQKVQVTFKDFIFVVGSVLRTGLEQRLRFAVFCRGPDLEYSRAGFFWFFSVHNHGFFAAVRTHSPPPRKKKNTCTRVYRDKHGNLRNSRNIESSRSTSLEFEAFGNGSDNKLGRASAFGYFLSTTVVFAADRADFLKKKPVFMSIQL